MSKTIPARRIQLTEHAPKQYAAIYRLERSMQLALPLSDRANASSGPRS